MICLTLIQTIYQRSMRTNDVFQNSGMELLIEWEIKTYGYYGKGQEGQCLRSRITCSTWSTLIEVRECWWDQRLLIVSALSASGRVFFIILFMLMGVRKVLCIEHTRLPWHCWVWGGMDHAASFSKASDLSTVLKLCCLLLFFLLSCLYSDPIPACLALPVYQNLT